MTLQDRSLLGAPQGITHCSGTDTVDRCRSSSEMGYSMQFTLTRAAALKDVCSIAISLTDLLESIGSGREDQQARQSQSTADTTYAQIECKALLGRMSIARELCPLERSSIHCKHYVGRN